jgi:hypothetical protein
LVSHSEWVSQGETLGEGGEEASARH